MKVHATLSNLRIAPRKVRLVTHAIVGMDAQRALVTLSRTGKRAALPLTKLLASAVANATNNFGLSSENLFVAQVFVGDGLRLKRWMPKAFGRATPVIKRCSNVKVVLEERIEGKDRVAPRKAEKAASVEPVTAAKETPADGGKSGQAPAPVVPATPEAKTKVPKAGFSKKVFQRKSV